MSGECGPGTSDPVLYLGGFWIHECDHLHQVFDFSFRRKYLDAHPVDLDFVYFLVCQDFRFVWVDFEPLRFCIF